jgi:hypothetical protein
MTGFVIEPSAAVMRSHPSPETRKLAFDPPVEVVQLLKIGYATIYEDASPSRRVA